MRPLLILLSVSLGLGSCGLDVPSSDEPAALGGRVEASGFVLEVAVPGRPFSTSDAIPVATTLTWTGAAAKGRLWGSGSGPVAFLLAEVGGLRRSMGGAMTADCTMTEFPRGVPTAVPFRKNGGFDGADPNAAFYQAWYADPVLRLPAGRWQLTVQVGGMLAPCEADAPTLAATVGPIALEIR